MSSLAAILVLVVCPADTGHCISEPLRVVSYKSMDACENERPREIKYAKDMGLDVYGNCNPFKASLLKNGEQINIAAGMDLNTYSTVAPGESVSGLGFSE